MKFEDEEQAPIGVFIFFVAVLVLGCVIWGCGPSAMRRDPLRLEDFCARAVNADLSACRNLRRGP